MRTLDDPAMTYQCEIYIFCEKYIRKTVQKLKNSGKCLDQIFEASFKSEPENLYLHWRAGLQVSQFYQGKFRATAPDP